MYHVSAQGVDERMKNVHYYYYYAQNQVTLLVHVSPTMFVPNFVHSYNLTHDYDMLIVVISDGRHKPITLFF